MNSRRTMIVLALSGAAHLAVLAWLVQQRPTLPLAVATPIFEVTMAPRYLTPKAPPPRAQAPAARPAPLRLHRAVRREADAAVAPLPVPDLPVAPAQAADLNAAILPNPSEARTRAALRGGTPGCANLAASAMTREERERCLTRLGAGAKDAPYLPPSINRAKRAEWDAIAAKKDFVRKYNMPVGVTARDSTGAKDIPWVLGSGVPSH